MSIDVSRQYSHLVNVSEFDELHVILIKHIEHEESFQQKIFRNSLSHHDPTSPR